MCCLSLFGITLGNQMTFKTDETLMINQTFSLFFDQDTTIQDTINYNNLSYKLSLYCDNTIKKEDLTSIQEMINARDQKEMKEKFKKLKNRILSDNIHCDEAIILNKTAELIQKQYQQTQEKEEIKELTEKVQENQVITIKNKTKNLKDAFGEMVSKYTELLLQKELNELKEKGYLTNEDLNNLSGNIILQYQNNYGIAEGNYTAKRKSNNKIKDHQITITFNLLSIKEFLQDLEADLQRVFYHELGHYIYYTIEDKNEFTEICWEDGVHCKNSDFVSKYAKQSQEEDFAETFAQYYFETEKENKFYPLLENKSKKLTKKINQMKKIFQKE